MLIGFGTRNATIFENQFPNIDTFPEIFNIVSFRKSELVHTIIFSVRGQRTAEVVADDEAFLIANWDASFGLRSLRNPIVTLLLLK